MDQVPDRNRPVVFRNLGQIRAEVVVEGELALFGQQRDAQGNELFGDRPGIEDRRGCDGHAVFEIGHAVTVFVDDLALVDDGEGTSGRVGLVPFSEEGIDRFGGNSLGSGFGDEGQGAQGEEQKACEQGQRRSRHGFRAGLILVLCKYCAFLFVIPDLITSSVAYGSCRDLPGLQDGEIPARGPG